MIPVESLEAVFETISAAFADGDDGLTNLEVYLPNACTVVSVPCLQRFIGLTILHTNLVIDTPPPAHQEEVPLTKLSPS